MVDQPNTRDDDDGSPPPEVTVPPWLRTGQTRDQAVRSQSAAGESAAGQGGPDRDRTEAGSRGSSREAAPNRIRLGARRAPGDRFADRFADTVQDPVEGARPDAGGPARRVDDLSTLPLGSGPNGPAGPAAPEPREPRGTVGHTAGGTPDRVGRSGLSNRSRRIGLFAAAGVAVLAGSAVLGFVITRGAVAPVEEQKADCAAVSEPGRAAGDGPGSLDSPLGTVLAFDHAYYVERSAEKAFEAVSPSSRMTEEQLRADGVDRVPVGTTHCVDARALAPTLLEVTLTESPPDTEPVVIRQHIRVAENPDGTWGIVTITPAG
ncbi:hypothetical protein R4P08_12555 [Rhodococcus sp. IEGM 1408]|nr:hypothetical protein [Rhodococcus sp. IEGM 1408]